MVQRLDKEAIKKLQEHPEEFIYARPPTEEDFLILNPIYYRFVICGQVLPIGWYGSSNCNINWENLQIKHMDWMIDNSFRGIHVHAGDVLQINWRFTVS